MTDTAPAWLVAARRAVLAAAVALLAVPACSPSVSDLASFIGSTYGDLSENVTDLEGDDLDAVMTELMLRFRTYLALRTIIPFSELAPEQCMSNVESGSSRFAFTADVNCTFGDAFAPAEGQIDIAQEQELWAAVAFTVVFSVLVHGVSATRVMRMLDDARAQGPP